MTGRAGLFSAGVIAVAGPLFVFPRERWIWALLPIAIFLFLLQRSSERGLIAKSPINAPLALLMIVAFASVFVTKDIGESSGKLAGLVYGVIVFFALIDALNTPKRIRFAVLVFLAMGMALAIVGVLGREDYHKPFFEGVEAILPRIPRLNLHLAEAERGVNLNPLGGILLLFFPLGISQIYHFGRKNSGAALSRMRMTGLVLASAVLGCLTFAIVLTASFGTWFSLVIALWLMGEKRRSLKSIAAGVGLVIGIFLLMRPGPEVKSGDRTIRGTLIISIEGRVKMWKNGLEIAAAHPVLGIGMDQLRRTPRFSYRDSHAHNQFLHTAAELGIPGLISYAAILLGIFWMAQEVRGSILPEWMRTTSRGLGAGIFAFTLFGLADAIPLGAKPGVFFWISLSLITSVYLFGRKNGLLRSLQPEISSTQEIGPAHD